MQNCSAVAHASEMGVHEGDVTTENQDGRGPALGEHAIQDAASGRSGEATDWAPAIGAARESRADHPPGGGSSPRAPVLEATARRGDAYSVNRNFKLVSLAPTERTPRR
jgi:hypothetical protein